MALGASRSWLLTWGQGLIGAGDTQPGLGRKADRARGEPRTAGAGHRGTGYGGLGVGAVGGTRRVSPGGTGRSTVRGGRSGVRWWTAAGRTRLGVARRGGLVALADGVGVAEPGAGHFVGSSLDQPAQRHRRLPAEPRGGSQSHRQRRLDDRGDELLPTRQFVLAGGRLLALRAADHQRVRVRFGVWPLAGDVVQVVAYAANVAGDRPLAARPFSSKVTCWVSLFRSAWVM